MLVVLAGWFAGIGFVAHIFAAVYAWNSQTVREWRCDLFGHDMGYDYISLDSQREVSREQCERCYYVDAVRVVSKRQRAR